MYEWLKETLVNRLMLPEGAVTADASPETVGLDSLAVTELAMIAQEQWAVVVDEDEIAACATIGDVAALIERRRQQPAAR
ncbi:acyl carrier protein [Streptomyces sp. NPDC048659]|uniref:acyl carrier protein n=1 Tax=Streptomyces sp. NPDC048659 TaxID=3155489 RepID=UPI0034401D22